MTNRQQLMHIWQPHLATGYICAKCGAIAPDWYEVEDISHSPCVNDNDPVVAKVQAMVNTEIASMWRQIRQREFGESLEHQQECLAAEASIPSECEERDWAAMLRQTEQDKEEELVLRHNLSSEEKARYQRWLNSSDPVNSLEWFEAGGDYGR